MTNNHMLYYKPGLTMDHPVTVSMAAADWAIFMSWVTAADTDGVSHIVYGNMSPQIVEQLYTPASLKAAKASHAELPPELIQHLKRMGVPDEAFGGQALNPEDFTDGE
jgi:hypothetical protein